MTVHIFLIIFTDMQPTSYVIVKGSCQFVEQGLTEVGLSMGLENGVISLVTKTYGMSEIFVNSNHFSEEVIFTHKGQLEQGLHSWVDEMQQVIKLAVNNLSEQKMSGGIFYMHANIPEGSFNYKQSFFIGLYLSVMVINDNFENKTIDQMIDQISRLSFIGSKQQVERLFREYQNRQFNLTLPDMLSMKGKLQQFDLQQEENMTIMIEQQFEGLEKQLKNKNGSQKSIKNIHHHIGHNLHTNSQVQKTHLQLPMPKDYKLLFCKLDLAKDDVEYELHRRQQIMKRKGQLLVELKQKYQVNGLFQMFHTLQGGVKLQDMVFQSQYERVYKPKSMQELQCLEQVQILNEPNKLIEKLLFQTQLVSDFTNDKINLQQLINQIWQINSQHLKIHSSEVVELVEDMKQLLNINGCMILNRNFLLIVVHKNHFTELLCEVKHKMNRGELKSKSLFRIQDQELVQQRWPSDKVIGQKIFSSVPAQGVGIFDPSEAIWFD